MKDCHAVETFWTIATFLVVFAIFATVVVLVAEAYQA